jgi:hypothetical protein
MDDDLGNSKLLFIDCGGGAITQNGWEDGLHNQLRYPGRRLGELFRGVRMCEVFITHNHVDHYNLYEMIYEVGRECECSVLYPIQPITGREFREGKRDERLLRRDREFFLRDLPKIENALGPHVRIVPIRPEVWQDSGVGSLEHDFNMMYLIEFAGRSILFPGDVGPQLLARVRADHRYRREMAAVDFLVLAHHGSNQVGELIAQCGIKPEMCMICSDPEEKDGLPRNGLKGLSLKRRYGTVTEMHIVSTYEKKEETQLPVFVTCDAAQRYYELDIDMDGTATLFDGPMAKSLNLFSFQSL